MGYDDFSRKVEEHYYDGEPHSFNSFMLGLSVSIAYLSFACLQLSILQRLYSLTRYTMCCIFWCQTTLHT